MEFIQWARIDWFDKNRISKHCIIFNNFPPRPAGSRAGGRKGRGLGGRNFRPPALAAPAAQSFFGGGFRPPSADAFFAHPAPGGIPFSFFSPRLKIRRPDFLQKKVRISSKRHRRDNLVSCRPECIAIASQKMKKLIMSDFFVLVREYVNREYFSSNPKTLYF